MSIIIDHSSVTTFIETKEYTNQMDQTAKSDRQGWSGQPPESDQGSDSFSSSIIKTAPMLELPFRH